MPEGDRFDKKIRRGWTGAFGGVESGESTPEIAASDLATPLAQDLKKGGGFPGSDKIVDIVNACAGSRVYGDAFDALDRVGMEYGGYRHTLLHVQAAKTLLLTERTSEALKERTFAERRLMEQACHDLVDNSFFGVGRYQLIESGRFVSETEARQYERRVHEALGPAVNRITEKLLTDPTGKSIQVPRPRTRKPTTQELLGRAINLA